MTRLGIRCTVVDRQPLTQTVGHLVFYLWLARGQKSRGPCILLSLARGNMDQPAARSWIFASVLPHAGPPGLFRQTGHAVCRNTNSNWKDTHNTRLIATTWQGTKLARGIQPRQPRQPPQPGLSIQATGTGLNATSTVRSTRLASSSPLEGRCVESQGRLG